MVIYFGYNYLIELNFAFSFTGNFFFLGGLVYFVLDFRSMNFFMVTKIRKMLEL